MTATKSISETTGARVPVLIGIVAGVFVLRMTVPIQNWQPVFSGNIADAFIRNNPRCNMNLLKSISIMFKTDVPMEYNWQKQLWQNANGVEKRFQTQSTSSTVDTVVLHVLQLADRGKEPVRL